MELRWNYDSVLTLLSIKWIMIVIDCHLSYSVSPLCFLIFILKRVASVGMKVCNKSTTSSCGVVRVVNNSGSRRRNLAAVADARLTLERALAGSSPAPRRPAPRDAVTSLTSLPCVASELCVCMRVSSQARERWRRPSWECPPLGGKE